MKHIKTPQELNEASENLNISDVIESELRQDFYNLIAGDWANHEDDYPYVEQTVDECVEIVKKYINKIHSL